MSGAPGPDGRHDDLDAGELEGLALLVPDDPRSLDADRIAYLNELRRRRRDKTGKASNGAADPNADAWSGRGWRGLGLLVLRRLARFGISGPMLVLGLAAVAVIGSSLTLFAPQSGNSSVLVAPLATNPPADVGSIGGLLPDGTLMVDGTSVSMRSARPALLALVPANCKDCGDRLRNLLTQGREYGLRLVLAGPSSEAGQLNDLNTSELGGSGLVAVDTSNTLNSTYGPTGVTALLVHEDGVLGAVERNITATQRLEPALTQLERPGAPTASP
jgi:hypothetical protein